MKKKKDMPKEQCSDRNKWILDPVETSSVEYLQKMTLKGLIDWHGWLSDMGYYYCDLEIRLKNFEQNFAQNLWLIYQKGEEMEPKKIKIILFLFKVKFSKSNIQLRIWFKIIQNSTLAKWVWWNNFLNL
jgi:hypothetical protein